MSLTRLNNTVGGLTLIACLASLCAMITYCIGYASPAWIASDGNSPFVRIGFHEACFEDCQDPYCPANGDPQVVYSGCYWVYDYYYREITYWLLPPWLESLRNIGIVNIALTVFIFILTVIACGIALAERYTVEISRRRDRALQIMLFICAIVSLAAGIVDIIILSRFSLYAYERDWMPMPEKNHYGYSWWLVLAATVLLGVSFLSAIFAGIIKTFLMEEDDDPRYSEDMMLGRGARA